MDKKTQQYLIREYIRNIILNEDDGGDYGGTIGGGLAGATGIGMDIVSNDVIDRTLFKGWRDLFKTATSAAKSLTASAICVTKMAFDTAVNTIIPWYKEDYKKIFAKHQEAQNRIRQQQAPVYNSIKQALSSNDDFLVSAMFYDPTQFFNTTLKNPSAFVTGVGIAKAPDALASIWDVLSGGGMLKQAIENFYAGKDLPKVKDSLKNSLSKNVYSSIFGNADFKESFIRKNYHQKLHEASENDAKLAIQVLTNPNIVKMVLNSSEVNKFIQAQQKVYNDTFQQIIKTVQEAMNAHSINDFANITKEQFEIPTDQMPQDDQRRLLEDIKKTIKKMYVDALSTEMAHVAKVAGDDNDLTKAYQKTINVIEAL